MSDQKYYLLERIYYRFQSGPSAVVLRIVPATDIHSSVKRISRLRAFDAAHGGSSDYWLEPA